MAQDSEKRFHSILEKLFRAPKPQPNPNSSSSPGDEMSRGKKRPNPWSALALVEPNSGPNTVLGLHNSSAEASQAPLCRPWDRGDLLRRLATFKSMTWFAKPKVVSAVNCARRGWINVDMDIIACEACGARLMFSTPSSWSQHQVEKAALVFSLKLDTGHKILCPWMDNACDETLAQFPPMLPTILVDKFQERSSVLLQLLALPVISSSAIEFMKSPQLEQFLGQSSASQGTKGSSDVSPIEYLGNGCEADSAKLYYQAQKLISLCGWEPRLLLYVVDCNNESNLAVKDGIITSSSHVIANKTNSSISVLSVGNEGNVLEHKMSGVSCGLECDPKSVVLDCRLCGASVGLWVFLTVPRPVELFRIVGYSEVNSESSSGAHDVSNEIQVDSRGGVVNTVCGATTSKERSSNLNLTIAGGPPPAKQNFKATISLPVIGQNLRARLSYDSDFGDRVHVNHDNITSESKNKNLFEERYIAKNTLSVENFRSGEGTSDSGPHDTVMESPMESMHNVVQVVSQNDNLTENPVTIGSVNADVGDDSSVVTADATITTRNEETSENQLPATVASESCMTQFPANNKVLGKESSESSHYGSSCLASSAAANPNVDNACMEDLREGSDVQNTLGAEANSEGCTTVEERRPIPVNNEGMTISTGNNPKQVPLDKSMEFDPIRQHRHFCPWIASTGSGAPGWKQMLSALQCKDLSPSPTKSQSASLIKVDDPVASVRKLFMTPSPKRLKSSQNST